MVGGAITILKNGGVSSSMGPGFRMTSHINDMEKSSKSHGFFKHQAVECR